MSRNIADQLIDLRVARDLTQEELAEKAGTSPTTISNLESGKVAKPQYRTLRKVAAALGVGVEELTIPKAVAPRPDSEDAALAVLFRGLALRGRKIVERSVKEGASEQLAKELAEYHAEAAALHRITGGRDIHGRASEELHEAEEAYQEAESRIQAMLAQDLADTGEEVRTRRLRSRGGAGSGGAETEAG